MNSDSNYSETLTRFSSQLFDEGLSETQTRELEAILTGDKSAQEQWVKLCEMQMMLEAEPSIRRRLNEDQLPGNVLSLPGSKSLSPLPEEKTAPTEAASPRALSMIIFATAAALIAAFFVVPSLQKSESPLGDLANTDGPVSNDIVESDRNPDLNDPAAKNDDPPEKQYERAILASLGPGSQQRPPTNFSSEPSLANEEISYNRDIRPILSDNCFSCHGPDEAGRKAKLRLDTAEGATGGEFPAIVPGHPEKSEAIARLTADDIDEIMPPPESHKTLTPKQIQLLTRWVQEGAEWEDHWSFMPITSALPDDVEGSPVDHFVDEKLATVGLLRSEKADRQTLVRRAFLDLIGLPPTPEEVDSFLTDETPEAYDKLINELMTRSNFGEHRARYWLDAARYGDTHGLHLDNYREIWPYRDWVIKAFNDNKPFDEFTIEQIAGDMIPDASQDQIVATGFNRCNVTTSEGGAIEEEFLVRYAVDRVSTTSTVWMGLTTGCAQCHDHKFDPFSMKDFYSLFAFFNNTTQPGMDGNAKDSPPQIRVWDSPEQKAEAETYEKQIASIKKTTAAEFKTFSPDDHTFESIAPEIYDHGRKPEPSDLGSIGGFGKDDAFSVAFRYSLPQEDGRLVLIDRTDPDQNDRGWRVVWEDRGMLVEFIESAPDKMLKRGMTRRFRPGSSGHFAFTYDGSGHSEGIQLYLNGAPMGSRFVNEWHDSLETDFDAEAATLELGRPDGTGALMPTIMEFVLHDRKLTDEEMKAYGELYVVRAAMKKEPAKRSKKEKEQWKHFAAVFSEGSYSDLLKDLSVAGTQLSKIKSGTPTTLVMNEKDGEPKAHILLRGEYEQKADEVSPEFPKFLEGFGEDLPRNRLGLAKWLVHPDHPLTARVTVNRIWQELFGVGLVKTSEDFGTQGESPSHPELLDWLALSFIESGWDVKQLYRTIMLSETYQQSSKIRGEMAKLDPENRLLARGPRFRLDAEVIRDQALAASGLMDNAVGGPSVKPYQPSGIWEAVGYTNSNTQTFYQDFGPSAEHRRSLYSFWKRTAHPPNLAIMDAPNRESCVMRRERTNTPLQALVLMNDPQFVRAARFLALRVLGEETLQEDRVERLGQLLRGRSFDEEESKIIVNSLDQFRNTYESDQEAAKSLLVDEVNEAFSIQPPESISVPELAAWTMIASQVINLDEVLNKN